MESNAALRILDVVLLNSPTYLRFNFKTFFLTLEDWLL